MENEFEVLLGTYLKGLYFSSITYIYIQSELLVLQTMVNLYNKNTLFPSGKKPCSENSHGLDTRQFKRDGKGSTCTALNEATSVRLQMQG